MNATGTLRALAIGLVLAACSGSRGRADAARSAGEPTASLAFEALSEERPALDEPADIIAGKRDLPPAFTHAKDGPPAVVGPKENVVLGRIVLEMPSLLTEEDKRELARLNNFQRGARSMEITGKRRRAIAEKVAAFAAEKGANAVYWASDDSVWALYVSAEAPPPGPDTNVVLSEVIPRDFKEVKRISAPLDAARPGSLVARVERGSCYGIATALAPDAQRERNWGWGVTYDATKPRGGDLVPVTAVRVALPSAMDGPGERGYFEETLCPLVSEELTFQLYLHQNVIKTRPVGKGEVVVVLARRPAKPEEIVKKSCSACAPADQGCSAALTHAACKASVACLKTLKMTPGQCP